MGLRDTIDLMVSDDYKDRFKAEFYQTYIRYRRLVDMVRAWDNGTLDFTPTCPHNVYDRQLEYMNGYLDILRSRAEIEHIDLR